MKNTANGKTGIGTSERKMISSLKRPLVIIPVIISVLLLGIAVIYCLNRASQAEIESENISSPLSRADAEIPEMNPTYILNETYTDISAFRNDPLEYIVESEIYSRDIRIVQIFNGESRGEKYIVSKVQDSLKAESDSEVILLTNGKLYADYGTDQVEHEADEDTFYRYIGITSLKMVCDMVRNTEAYDSKLSLSDDCLNLTAEITQKNADLKMVFEINTETGIVVSERFYYMNEPYRYIQTESIKHDFKPGSSFFEMP